MGKGPQAGPKPTAPTAAAGGARPAGAGGGGTSRLTGAGGRALRRVLTYSTSGAPALAAKLEPNRPIVRAMVDTLDRRASLGLLSYQDYRAMEALRDGDAVVVGVEGRLPHPDASLRAELTRAMETEVVGPSSVLEREEALDVLSAFFAEGEVRMPEMALALLQDGHFLDIFGLVHLFIGIGNAKIASVAGAKKFTVPAAFRVRVKAAIDSAQGRIKEAIPESRADAEKGIGSLRDAAAMFSEVLFGTLGTIFEAEPSGEGVPEVVPFSLASIADSLYDGNTLDYCRDAQRSVLLNLFRRRQRLVLHCAREGLHSEQLEDIKRGLEVLELLAPVASEIIMDEIEEAREQVMGLLRYAHAEGERGNEVFEMARRTLLRMEVAREEVRNPEWAREEVAARFDETELAQRINPSRAVTVPFDVPEAPVRGSFIFTNFVQTATGGSPLRAGFTRIIGYIREYLLPSRVPMPDGSQVGGRIRRETMEAGLMSHPFFQGMVSVLAQSLSIIGVNFAGNQYGDLQVRPSALHVADGEIPTIYGNADCFVRGMVLAMEQGVFVSGRTDAEQGRVLIITDVGEGTRSEVPCLAADNSKGGIPMGRTNFRELSMMFSAALLAHFPHGGRGMVHLLSSDNCPMIFAHPTLVNGRSIEKTAFGFYLVAGRGQLEGIPDEQLHYLTDLGQMALYPKDGTLYTFVEKPPVLSLLRCVIRKAALELSPLSGGKPAWVDHREQFTAELADAFAGRLTGIGMETPAELLYSAMASDEATFLEKTKDLANKRKVAWPVDGDSTARTYHQKAQRYKGEKGLEGTFRNGGGRVRLDGKKVKVRVGGDEVDLTIDEAKDEVKPDEVKKDNGRLARIDFNELTLDELQVVTGLQEELGKRDAREALLGRLPCEVVFAKACAEKLGIDFSRVTDLGKFLIALGTAQEADAVGIVRKSGLIGAGGRVIDNDTCMAMYALARAMVYTYINTFNMAIHYSLIETFKKYEKRSAFARVVCGKFGAGADDRPLKAAFKEFDWSKLIMEAMMAPSLPAWRRKFSSQKAIEVVNPHTGKAEEVKPTEEDWDTLWHIAQELKAKSKARAQGEAWAEYAGTGSGVGVYIVDAFSDIGTVYEQFGMQMRALDQGPIRDLLRFAMRLPLRHNFEEGVMLGKVRLNAEIIAAIETTDGLASGRPRTVNVAGVEVKKTANYDGTFSVEVGGVTIENIDSVYIGGETVVPEGATIQPDVFLLDTKFYEVKPKPGTRRRAESRTPLIIPSHFLGQRAELPTDAKFVLDPEGRPSRKTGGRAVVGARLKPGARIPADTWFSGIEMFGGQMGIGGVPISTLPTKTGDGADPIFGYRLDGNRHKGPVHGLGGMRAEQFTANVAMSRPRTQDVVMDEWKARQVTTSPAPEGLQKEVEAVVAKYEQADGGERR